LALALRSGAMSDLVPLSTAIAQAPKAREISSCPGNGEHFDARAESNTHPKMHAKI
jgi:hypothetical protein